MQVCNKNKLFINLYYLYKNLTIVFGGCNKKIKQVLSSHVRKHTQCVTFSDGIYIIRCSPAEWTINRVKLFNPEGARGGGGDDTQMHPRGINFTRRRWRWLACCLCFHYFKNPHSSTHTIFTVLAPRNVAYLFPRNNSYYFK